MQQEIITGYPSIDKPWLKYYSRMAREAKLPECTIFEYIYDCNQNNLNRVALEYYVTEDGFVYICGRLKRYMMYIADDLHKKMFSLDIEKILVRHSKIERCAVVPVKDSITFQSPIAFIILKREVQDVSIIEKELIDYEVKNLEKSYRPIRHYFVKEFPLTKVGKVNYLELERLAQKMIDESI